MKILKSLEELRAWRASVVGSVGFVPTMGQLHEGHLALLRQARQENQAVLLSIFVNPTQFNDPKDFASYPKNLEQDSKLAESVGTDAVWCPHQATLYPDDYQFQIHETALSPLLEGACRPGHFTGMLTVVMKLLQAAQATKAYFGEKDYQQLKLVQGLTRAFLLETQIVPCPIVRDQEGLALSSRHRRMSQEEIQLARQFSKIFLSAESPEACQQSLNALGIAIEYNQIHHDRWLIAVKIGQTRLLDNKAYVLESTP